MLNNLSPTNRGLGNSPRATIPRPYLEMFLEVVRLSCKLILLLMAQIGAFAIIDFSIKHNLFSK